MKTLLRAVIVPLAALAATAVWAETATPQSPGSTTILGTRNPNLVAGADALLQGNYAAGVELTVAGLKAETDPRDMAAGLSNLCAGYVALQQFDLALEKCDAALAIDPVNWRTWNNRAAAYVGMGMFDAALESVSTGLERFPESATLKKTRSIVLAHKRAFEREQRRALKT